LTGPGRVIVQSMTLEKLRRELAPGRTGGDEKSPLGALGGILGHWSLSLPGWLAAALASGAAVVTWGRLPESRKRTQADAENWLHPSRFTPVFRKPVLVQLLVIGFCIMAAFVMMESTITLFLNKIFGWAELGVGLYFLFIGIIIVGVQGGLIGRLTRKLGDWPLCITGPVLVAVGMGGYIALGYVGGALAVGMSLLLFSGAINATGRSFQQPTLSSLLSKFSDRGEQGVVFGLYHGLSSLARVAGPVVAGFAYPHLRNTGQFLVAAVIALLIALWTAALRQSPPDEVGRLQGAAERGELA